MKAAPTLGDCLPVANRRRAAPGWLPLLVTGIAACIGSAVALSAETEYGKRVPPGARAGDLSMAPCQVHLPGDDRNYAGDCGTLVVPEFRGNPDARLIALPVTRIRATGADPLEPIFTFNGGPGSPNEFRLPSDGLLERHDLVQVGYRGIDGQVVLECPENAAAMRAIDGNYLSDEALASLARATAACARRLRAEGIDLDGYSMNQTVDDMEAARIALGYERIDLLGKSYGTRLEMIYQWRHPESLHRVVMVAANPPGHFVWLPQVVDAQLGQYAELCARDTHCSARTPDLIATLREVSRNMPTSWLGISIDPDAVRILTFLSLHESVQVPGSPVPLSGPAAIDLWLDAAEGDASGMALISLAAPLFLPEMGRQAHLLAMGGSAPDYLGPERDFRAELMPDGAVLGSPGALLLAGMVPGWPASRDQQSYAAAQDTAIPTLVISGSIDFSTPMQAARDELLPHLRNGHQVILRDIGHTVSFWNSQPQARARLLNTWFDTGTVDASLYRYQAPVFDVEQGWDGLARTLLAAAVAVLALVLLLILVIGRRLRRRYAS